MCVRSCAWEAGTPAGTGVLESLDPLHQDPHGAEPEEVSQQHLARWCKVIQQMARLSQVANTGAVGWLELLLGGLKQAMAQAAQHQAAQGAVPPPRPLARPGGVLVDHGGSLRCVQHAGMEPKQGAGLIAAATMPSPFKGAVVQPEGMGLAEWKDGEQHGAEVGIEERCLGAATWRSKRSTRASWRPSAELSSSTVWQAFSGGDLEPDPLSAKGITGGMPAPHAHVLPLTSPSMQS